MRISDCSSDVCSSDLGSAVAEQAGAFIDRLARVPERLWDRGAGLDALLEGAREPFVLRGLVADWPLVAAGNRSARDARAYLLDHARDRKSVVWGKSVSVGVALGGRRISTTKTKIEVTIATT